MAVTITVDHRGTDYKATFTTVLSTKLGWEDHGFFTFSLECEGSGIGVNVGGITLDGAPIVTGGSSPRTPTASGMAVLFEVMHTFGVRSWEDIRGKDIYVLWENDIAVGLADPSTERSMVFREFTTRLSSTEYPSL